MADWTYQQPWGDVQQKVASGRRTLWMPRK